MAFGAIQRIRRFRGMLDSATDCHCEERSDEAISRNASNRIEIASLALRASSQ
jgi:hypothetical protein